MTETGQPRHSVTTIDQPTRGEEIRGNFYGVAALAQLVLTPFFGILAIRGYIQNEERELFIAFFANLIGFISAGVAWLYRPNKKTE